MPETILSDAVRFLEGQTHYPDQIAVNNKLQQVLQMKAGQRWLEAGSGSGALCRQMWNDLQPGGWLYGLDLSFEYLLGARYFSAQSGGQQGFSLHNASADRLPYAASAFDGAFAARLLLNVPNPDDVLAEMVRVVRPGGQIVLLDWDFDTFIVDHCDRALTRRILRWRADNYGSNSWSGRQLWGRMSAAGLQELAVTPVVSYGCDDKAAIYDALRRAARAALDKQAVSQDEYDAWIAELQSRLAQNRFFASIVYFIVSAIK